MYKSLLSLIAILSLLYFNLDANANSRERVDRVTSSVRLEEGVKYPTSNVYNSKPITLEGYRDGADYIIRPEVVTSIDGYYDWQTNGPCPNFVSYISPTIIHAIQMVATDSTDLSGSRRTSYAFSSDGGATWGTANTVPNIRSGFPTLTAGNTGASDDVAIIGNHYQPGAVLSSGVHVDAFPGLGSFTSTFYPGTVSNFIWPQLNTYSNGDVMVSAETYQGGAATDTGYTTTFNPNTNTWSGSSQLFVSSATSQLNMRWTSATGPGGRGIYVLNPISDVGDPLAGARIFYYTTSDNGATWSSANQLYETTITGADTNFAWLGCDAVYDNAGNFYVVWNTTSTTFSQTKLWVSKNGGTPVVVTQVSDIPGGITSMVTAMGNASGLDWPTIAVTADGNHVMTGYSVCMQADTLNGFNSFDLYYSVSPTSALSFSEPRMITSGMDDERYISFNNTTTLDGGSNEIMAMTYQKDPQPGSCAFNDNAPVSKNRLIYREIENPQTSIHNVSGEIPGSFRLLQNYPNPFNPTTMIRFELPNNVNVSLKVYDITGKEVATLINNQILSAGTKEFDFNGANLGSGIYFYTLKAGDFTQTKKMLLVK